MECDINKDCRELFDKILEEYCCLKDVYGFQVADELLYEIQKIDGLI